jgi:uncharacterized protein (DUF169 family)
MPTVVKMFKHPSDVPPMIDMINTSCSFVMQPRGSLAGYRAFQDRRASMGKGGASSCGSPSRPAIDMLLGLEVVS